MVIAFTESEDEFEKYAGLIYDGCSGYTVYPTYNDYEGIDNLKTVNDNAGIKR